MEVARCKVQVRSVICQRITVIRLITIIINNNNISSRYRHRSNSTWRWGHHAGSTWHAGFKTRPLHSPPRTPAPTRPLPHTLFRHPAAARQGCVSSNRHPLLSRNNNSNNNTCGIYNPTNKFTTTSWRRHPSRTDPGGMNRHATAAPGRGRPSSLTRRRSRPTAPTTDSTPLGSVLGGLEPLPSVPTT